MYSRVENEIIVVIVMRFKGALLTFNCSSEQDVKKWFPTAITSYLGFADVVEGV
jgi:hypothetical protein